MEDTLTGNKLIAYFDLRINTSELEYHNSWNRLMPVIEKIKQMQHDPKEMFMGTTMQRKLYFESVTTLPIHISIGIAFKIIVQFIQWYNTTTTPLNK